MIAPPQTGQEYILKYLVKYRDIDVDIGRGYTEYNGPFTWHEHSYSDKCLTVVLEFKEQLFKDLTNYGTVSLGEIREVIIRGLYSVSIEQIA